MRPALVKNDFLNEDTGLTAAHICELSVVPVEKKREKAKHQEQQKQRAKNCDRGMEL